uniref:DRBM domain-containing protein n=1 Tax=Pavo cristatus TaxID=9049 RepID=A0A8C9G0T0_PAVCR
MLPSRRKTSLVLKSGPPHMKSFVTRVTVGEFTAEGEGNSKKLSKKRAAMSVLQELRKLPPLPVIEKPKLYFKKPGVSSSVVEDQSLQTTLDIHEDF